MNCQIRCLECGAKAWVKATAEGMYVYVHEDVDLEEAEWSRGEWPECSHENYEIIDSEYDDSHL